MNNINPFTLIKKILQMTVEQVLKMLPEVLQDSKNEFSKTVLNITTHVTNSDKLTGLQKFEALESVNKDIADFIITLETLAESNNKLTSHYEHFSPLSENYIEPKKPAPAPVDENGDKTEPEPEPADKVKTLFSALDDAEEAQEPESAPEPAPNPLDRPIEIDEETGKSFEAEKPDGE